MGHLDSNFDPIFMPHFFLIPFLILDDLLVPSIEGGLDRKKNATLPEKGSEITQQ
jgi:hypothetical protein